ncbi:chloride channel protein [Bremerella sp. JC817]|uniref:chloride channel protein n=1 Tax=Bremerella sp. JC817 TaxID=3231756 RepID=UPI003458267A
MAADAQPSTTDEKPLNLWLLAVLGVFTGVIAGVGAWGFRMVIGLVHNVLFLGQFAFEYDANLHTAPSPFGWAIIFVPVIGALIVAWLVGNFAPEAKGHGVPEVMDAIYYHDGIIRPRVAAVKALASAFSIGSGAAVGREGPIIQIGSAFGSTVGQLIRMSSHDRITLIAAGSGAGIAATFNAPLGGVVFAIELLLTAISARTLMVVSAATVTATYISQRLIGVDPSFNIPALEQPVFQLDRPEVLLLFIPLGVIVGFLSVVFIRGIYGMEDIFERIPGNYYTRHALGMICVGVMMYILLRTTGHYYIQGVGYASIMDVLQGVLTNPSLLLLLLVLKLLATSLSLGSGASGGVFSPALFVGATGGAAFGHLCMAMFPGLELDLATFAIAGMAASIAGSTGAMLTGIIMISEMTQDSTVVLPLILAVSVASAIRRGVMRESVYTMKLIHRGHIVTEGLQSPFLGMRWAGDVMAWNFAVQGEGAVVPKGSTQTILVEKDGQVVDIYQPASQLEPGQSPETTRYITICERDDLPTVLHAMDTAESDIALVSRNPTAPTASDVIGVLTRSRLMMVLQQQKKLL